MTKKPEVTEGPVWDWAAGHGPVTGALSATTGAFALATTGAATGMPPTWALTVGAAGAIGHTISGLRQRLAARTIATRAASWMLAAGWTTWAMTTGPLSWAALGSLATIGVGIGASTASTNLHEEARELEALAVEQRQIALELSAERREIAAEWVERIQRICGIKVRILAVEQWPTGAGFSIDGELSGGTTYDVIARESAKLSADARLPHGCTASASPGIDQGRFILDVTTVNMLETEATYPTGYEALSIHTGMPWGYRTNAEDICAYLREQCALVVGPTGSGKTNMVHVILAGMARAVDILTWVIDLNAGSAGLPWIRPALDHEGNVRKDVKPGVDWVASTHKEALVMLDAALRIARQRKVAYQDLMASHNTDLLPISAQIPQIMLVIDEGAEILVSRDPSLKKVAERVLEVIRIARAMGIRTVLTALGATSSVLGNLMIRREAKVRVALTGGETEGMDLSKMFPGVRGLRVDQAPYKGAGFMGTPESPGALFKTWRILPNQIRDIVEATSNRRPALDAVSVKAAGIAYTQRWDTDRTAWMRDNTPASEPGAGHPGPAEGEPRRAGLNLSALREQPATDEADVLAQQFMREIDAQFGTTTEPAPANERPRPGLNLSALREENETPETGPAWLAEAVDAISAAGTAGMKPGAVADLVGKDRKTVRAALQSLVERGELVYVDNGPRSVYVHPEHA
ncbi:hypothetical protein [Streptomyces sp. SCSIO ZS0520]|uniref:hypothetical protein n=1 Tax=Streptomyces sp. SCSIO ZS0520 TaxID=2892996 RepID=UPI0021D83CFD|nr:hypothetical protein [Streptomyces sp. SCSIO ZS0520]